MRLVIDTNVIISAIIKSGLTRDIIISKTMKLLTPDYSLEEIEKYKEYICSKIGITKEDVEILINYIFENIEIVPLEDYKKDLNKAKEIMDKIDKDDTPFIAAALALNCGVWSDDEHFQKQNKVKIFKTKDLRVFIKTI